MKNEELRTLIKSVCERIDIVEVVGSRIELGRNHKAVCPFHDDRSPSFSVNANGQYFYCFGCGVGGDVFEFLVRYDETTFIEALLQLARQAAVPIPTLKSEVWKSLEERRRIQNVLSETARFYHENLTPEIVNYLIQRRGLTKETIKRFQVGYAQGGLREHLSQKQISMDDCLKAGVVRKTKEGVIKDYFYRRIVLPNIYRGRVVHVTSRNIDDSEPKYLHLPGEIQYFYNEQDVSSGDIYVTEGPFDCLSAVQAGWHAVAILGIGRNDNEYEKKFSGCSTVYVCLDGDPAGKEAALRIGEAIGEKAKIVDLPEGLDLNDYLIQHSKEDFKELVASARTTINCRIDQIPTDTRKIDLPKKLEPILKKLADLEAAQAEAYLSYEIKSRFKLKQNDIEGYRETIKKRRKEIAQSGNQKSGQRDTEAVFSAKFDGLVDLVADDGEPAFLVKDGDALTVAREVELHDVHYVPPPKEQIPWRLPRGERVIAHYDQQKTLPVRSIDEALYDDLLKFHRSISELPGEEYYDLIVTWDFHTYLCESFQYSPIICLFAVPERGKSRTGKAMIHVAYRGIHVESMRDAYLVRVAHDLGATIFFDVKDVWKKAEKNQSEDILLHRFEKGAKVPRVLYPDRGAHRDIVYYSIFGPTIVATNENVHRILESRAIPIHMPEGSRRFENDVVIEESLKERLVAFRARHLGETLPAIDKPAAGRLGDILRPLRQIIRLVKPQREEVFLRLVEMLAEERLTEKADTLEAQILEIVVGLEDEVERSILPVKRITEELNEDRSERFRVTPHRVGRRLSAMGFKKARTHSGASAIIWDEEKIERMKEAYGLRQTSESSETSETPDLSADDTDVSDETDVFPGVCPQDSIPF